MSTSSWKYAPIPVWTVSNGVSSPISTVSYGFGSLSRSDTVRRKRPKGLEMLSQATAVSTNLVERRDCPLSWSYMKASGQTSVCYALGNLGYGGELPSLGVNENVVRNKLRAKARESSVNLANMLGEYRQTAELFSGCAKQVYTLTRALLARNPMLLRPSQGLSRGLSSAVLQYNYGILPLVSDINGSMEALKHAATIRPLYVRSNASSKWRGEKSYMISAASYGYPKVLLKSKYETVVSGWSVFAMKNDFLNATLGKYGMTNPFSLGWELTPWSFVVDWWFNVGEFIASLDNCLYMGAGYHQLTTRSTYKRSYEAFPNAFYMQKSISRSTVTGLSNVASLVYKPSTSKIHILNGVALLGQLIGKRASNP